VNLFWVMTLQWGSPKGTVTNTATGVIRAGQAGELGTRQRAYAAVYKGAKQCMGVPGEAVVLFYSLEPDDLTGGTP
jgi:hypothetical protein